MGVFDPETLFFPILAILTPVGGGRFRNPKGPKIEKVQGCPPGLKISSEIDNFKRATRQTLTFVGQISSEIGILSEIEVFNRD